MDASTSDMWIQFLPSVLLGGIYAILVYQIAKRRGVAPLGWVLGTLIPIIGLIVSAIFFYLSFLSVLDRLNKLENNEGTTA